MKRLLNVFSVPSVVFVLVIASTENVHANTGVSVDKNTGSAITSIPISVPSHHGLEPSLALSYSSSAGNGIMGVGWNLTGFPYIERQGADGGAPQYDSSDTYRYAGNDLLPCGNSSSPGCLAGGTHFSKHENYKRMAYDSGLDDWTITEKDGTQSKYTPLYATSGGIFRWGINTVTDVLGNSVSYQWWCDPGKNCFPYAVNYNGYQVRFYYEDTRTDKISFANGDALGETRQRLRSIKVELDGGSPIRAYKLVYSTSGSTTRSLLDSVQMYGNDVVIDSNGAITGGHSLEPERFSYLTDASDHSFTDGSVWSGGDSGKFGTGDFNGDGIQDVYYHEEYGGELNVGLSSGEDFDFTPWGAICGETQDWLSTGDFNGDGKTDFMCKHSYGPATVGLSDGDSLNISGWTGIWCKVTEGTFITGDFNGDGKTDAGCYINGQYGDGSGGVEVALSDGSTFVANWYGINDWCAYDNGTYWGENWGDVPKTVMVSDFDGDGNTDLACRWLYGSTKVWVALSDGDGTFTHDGEWLGALCPSYSQHGFGDFNGDGKSDLYCYDDYGANPTYTTEVALSDGGKFVDTGQWFPPAGCNRFGTGDMNGDGRTDVWCHTTSNGDTRVGLSNGTDSFIDWQVWRDNWCSTNTMVAGDFNGDSKADISCHSTSNVWVATSGGIEGKTDVLTLVENSLGGESSITYLPGTNYFSAETAPPAQTAISDPATGAYDSAATTHPMVPGGPVVKNITRKDGRGWYATTSYWYSNGEYDPEEREWYGFGTVVETLPAIVGESIGPRVRTWFSQERESAGTIVEQDYWNKNTNSILSRVYNTIVPGGDGITEPYTAEIREKRTFEFDDSGVGCSSYPCAHGERFITQFFYDDYGNQDEVRNYGSCDDDWGGGTDEGDETTTVTEYGIDTSNYIVNKPTRIVTYAGIGTSGATLSDSNFYYDTQGLLTNRSVWRDTDQSHIFQCGSQGSQVCFEYDTYGNLTKVKDQKGGETTIEYDPVYDKFPIETNNPLNHTVSTNWDAGCEVPLSSTNPNGQITSMTYDELCRITRTDAPLGLYQQVSYRYLGTPSSQYTYVETPSANGQGAQWSKNYFDGLGRSYKSVERGPTNIVTETTFNARSLAKTSSLPRYNGDPRYDVTYDYDFRSRLRFKGLPDGNDIEYRYGLRKVTELDPEGHKIVTRRSENGLTTYLDEYLGSTPVTTETVTDPVGRTQTIEDDDGNTWVTYFNSLGQIIQVDDPDAGTEIREYNDSGELVSVTNALGEETEFVYDAIGRMTSKTTRVGTPSAETTTFIYDQPRTDPILGDFYNIGLLTTMNDTAGSALKNYDELGRIRKEYRTLDGQEYWKQYGYLQSGHLQYKKFNDNEVIYTWYWSQGWLMGETGTISNAQYNALGQAVSTTYANTVTTTKVFSPTRGWVEEIETTGGGYPIQGLDYAYYPDGMIESITSVESAESWSYTYDTLNRLTQSTNVDTPALSQTFQYDPIGNITYNSHIGTYTYPNPEQPRPHAVQSAGGRTYLYNLMGQMTNRNGTNITWNGDGKPASIGNIGFTYDGVGNRLKKVSGGETTRYPFPDFEIADDGTTTKSLIGGKQVCTTSSCEFFMYHTDHLGSIQSITSSTAEVLHKKYRPFGDTHSTTGTHSDLRGWIGEREEETELVYLNARYYDPEIGRFISPDPIAHLGQKLNRYTYSRNNPINYLDPTGLDDAGTWFYWNEGTGGGYHVYVEVIGSSGLVPGVYPDPSEPGGGPGPVLPPPGGGDPAFEDEQGEQDGGGGGAAGAGGTGGTGGTGATGATGGNENNDKATCANGKKLDCPGNRRFLTKYKKDDSIVNTPPDVVPDAKPGPQSTPDRWIQIGGGLAIVLGVDFIRAGTASRSPWGVVPIGIGVVNIFLGLDMLDGEFDKTEELLDKLKLNGGKKE